MSSTETAYAAIVQRVRNAAAAAGRPGGAGLLAVSKGQSAAAIRALAAAGQRAFGENYVQEALAKQAELADLPLQWHLIGPLQSNKCREAARHFDWLHTLDRAKLIAPLAQHRPQERPPLNVLIQVDVDAEATKSGCRPDEIDALAAAVAQQPRLRLRGLMAIPAPWPDLERRRDAFARMRGLFEQLRRTHPAADTLSLGMSADFEAAIAAGSTLVRIGTALFGARH